MRLLLVALLAAISYAQTGVNCDDITIQDLDGKQFSAEDGRGYRYTIEVGPGGSLYQTEISGAQSTYYLGAHTGYSGEDAETFGSGDYCGDIGDDRSAKITYIFGEGVTELRSVTEPSTCYYELEIRVGSDVTECESVDTAADSITAVGICSEAQKICDGIVFPAGIAGEVPDMAPSSNCYGSVSEPRKPAWFVFQVADPGTLTFVITASDDVDHVIWGPFGSVEDAYSTCGALQCAGEVPGLIDSNYDGGVTNEEVTVPDASAGAYYILLITNFSGERIDVTLTLDEGASTGTISCDGVAGVTPSPSEAPSTTMPTDQPSATLPSVSPIEAQPAYCCSMWDAECYLTPSPGNFFHACRDCALGPCESSCADPASEECKNCCTGYSDHEVDWNCELVSSSPTVKPSFGLPSVAPVTSSPTVKPSMSSPSVEPTQSVSVAPTPTLPSVNAAGICADAEKICDGIVFPAGIAGEVPDFAPSSNCYGSVSEPRKPAWFVFEIAEPGLLQFVLIANDDVDHVIYGPFSSFANAKAHCDRLECSDVIDSNYDGGQTRLDITIPDVTAGQYYILLITNFSGERIDVSLVLDESASTASISCDGVGVAIPPTWTPTGFDYPSSNPTLSIPSANPSKAPVSSSPSGQPSQLPSSKPIVSSPTKNPTITLPSVEASGICTEAQKICDGIVFPAGIAGEVPDMAPSSNCYGVVSEPRKPAWFIFQVADPGTLKFVITASDDVDHVIWGPFATAEDAYSNCGTLQCENTTPGLIDSNYDGGVTNEEVTVPDASANAYYILLITNFSGERIDVRLTLDEEESTGSISCEGVGAASPSQQPITSLPSVNPSKAPVSSGPSGQPSVIPSSKPIVPLSPAPTVSIPTKTPTVTLPSVDASGICTEAQKICDGIVFPAGIAGEVPDFAPGSNCYGVVSEPRKPAWFVFQVADPGTLKFVITASDDVDHVIWGPFANAEDAYSNCGTLQCAGVVPGLIDSNYDGGVTNEEVIVPDASAGAYYILLITNFSGERIDVRLTLDEEESIGSISCEGVGADTTLIATEAADTTIIESTFVAPPTANPSLSPAVVPEETTGEPTEPTEEETTGEPTEPTEAAALPSSFPTSQPTVPLSEAPTVTLSSESPSSSTTMAPTLHNVHLEESGENECQLPYVKIESATICQEAAEQEGFIFDGTGDSWPVPYGCVCSNDRSPTQYCWFNSNEENLAKSTRQPLCILYTLDPTLDPTFEYIATRNPTSSVRSPEPTVSTTAQPSLDPTTTVPYRVFVKFISSYGCAIANPRISAMEWNFYNSEDATEIASEFFDFSGDLQSPSNEMPSNLADDNVNTKWLSWLNCSGDGDECVCTNEIELHFTLDEEPTHYAFVSGDHGQLRDPAIWEITFCCAAGSSTNNPYGCGETINVNVFEEPWSSIYGHDLGRVEESGRFPLGGCEMGPSQAPSRYQSQRPSKGPTKSPFTKSPSHAPYALSGEPTAAPLFQDHFEWDCEDSDEPTTCQESTHGLTQSCEVSDGSDFCCTVSDGSHYCCSVQDTHLALCQYTDSQCTLECTRNPWDTTQRTCRKECPDDPTISPSVHPSELCQDQDEVYSEDNMLYWDAGSQKKMTCQQVIDVLFINNEKDCSLFFARQCPRTCDACTQIPTKNPSSYPTASPIEPSGSPSIEPSKAPHPKCIDDYPVILNGERLDGTCEVIIGRILGSGEPCSEGLSQVCEASCPNACTEYPTKAPHVSPSRSPSQSPSDLPTSSNPSGYPSRTPSGMPSITPSKTPSTKPYLGCADVETVTLAGISGELEMTCPVAVQIVLDNNDECEGYLLEQCPDSCGMCTEEPSMSPVPEDPSFSPTTDPSSSSPSSSPSFSSPSSRPSGSSPTVVPSVSCYDRPVIYNENNELVEGMTCSQIVSILIVQYGRDNPCDDTYARQCPVSCGLCTFAPSSSPSTSDPSSSPSFSSPSWSPLTNDPSLSPSSSYPSASPSTSVIPTTSSQPSAAPYPGPPFDCGETLEECDRRYNVVFDALENCNNQAAAATDCPEVTCPETQCPTCPNAECEDNNTAETHVDTYNPTLSCTTASGSWIGQTIQGLDGFDRDTMDLCESDGQYMIATGGRVYPTCVEYIAPQQECTRDDLICPDMQANLGVSGWSGNHRFALTVAARRNDFRHQDCPTIQDQCKTIETFYESYWHNMFTDKTGLESAYWYNICVNPATNEVRYVTETAYVNTCVGFSHEPSDVCPTPRSFMCVGLSSGQVVYGWPGQIMEAVGQAVAEESHRHAQCPF